MGLPEVSPRRPGPHATAACSSSCRGQMPPAKEPFPHTDPPREDKTLERQTDGRMDFVRVGWGQRLPSEDLKGTQPSLLGSDLPQLVSPPQRPQM